MKNLQKLLLITAFAVAMPTTGLLGSEEPTTDVSVTETTTMQKIKAGINGAMNVAYTNKDQLINGAAFVGACGFIAAGIPFSVIAIYKCNQLIQYPKVGKLLSTVYENSKKIATSSVVKVDKLLSPIYENRKKIAGVSAILVAPKVAEVAINKFGTTGEQAPVNGIAA